MFQTKCVHNNQKTSPDTNPARSLDSKVLRKQKQLEVIKSNGYFKCFKINKMTDFLKTQLFTYIKQLRNIVLTSNIQRQKQAEKNLLSKNKRFVQQFIIFGILFD